MYVLVMYICNICRIKVNRGINLHRELDIPKRPHPSCHLRPRGARWKVASTGQSRSTARHADTGAVGPTAVYVGRGHRTSRCRIAELLLLLLLPGPKGNRRERNRSSSSSSSAAVGGTGRRQDTASDAAPQLFPRVHHHVSERPCLLRACCWYAACCV